MLVPGQGDVGEELKTDADDVGTIGRRRFEPGRSEGDLEDFNAVGSEEGGLVGDFSGAEVSEGFEG